LLSSVFIFIKAGLLSLFVAVPFAEVFRCRFPPVLMHTVTGTLVTLPVLSLVGYQAGDSIAGKIPILSKHHPKISEILKEKLFPTIIATTIGILFAQLFHVWWNTGGGDIVARFLGAPC